MSTFQPKINSAPLKDDGRIDPKEKRTPFNVYPIAIYLRRKHQKESGLFYFSVDKAPVVPFYRKALPEK